MTHPEYIYWGLLILIAIPLAPFNAAACVVLGMRLANQVAWAAGWPEDTSQLAIYSTGAAIGFAFSRGIACDVVASFSVALAATASAHAYHIITELQWWWTIFGLAIAQILLVPLCTDKAALRATIEAARNPSNFDGFRVLARRLVWMWK